MPAGRQLQAPSCHPAPLAVAVVQGRGREEGHPAEPDSSATPSQPATHVHAAGGGEVEHGLSMRAYGWRSGLGGLGGLPPRVPAGPAGWAGASSACWCRRAGAGAHAPLQCLRAGWPPQAIRSFWPAAPPPLLAANKQGGATAAREGQGEADARRPQRQRPTSTQRRACPATPKRLSTSASQQTKRTLLRRIGVAQQHLRHHWSGGVACSREGRVRGGCHWRVAMFGARVAPAARAAREGCASGGRCRRRPQAQAASREPSIEVHAPGATALQRMPASGGAGLQLGVGC